MNLIDEISDPVRYRVIEFNVKIAIKWSLLRSKNCFFEKMISAMEKKITKKDSLENSTCSEMC